MNTKILVDENQKADFQMPYEFPVKLYETDLGQKPSGVNQWHWHDELQFCIVLSGEVCMTVEETEYVLKAGDGIFVNAGKLHMSRSRGKKAAKYWCLNVNPLLISYFRGSILEQKYVLPYISNKTFAALQLGPQIIWQRTMLEQMKEIAAAMEQKAAYYELEVCSKLMELWKILIQNAQLEEDAESASMFNRIEIKRMLIYIHEHYEEEMNLDEIAEYVHASKSACCRMFKKALGCTIMDYLLEYRIQQSVQLLVNTDQPVSQIAYDVGFSGTSYYIKKFKELMKTTPNTFRRSQQQKSCDS